MSTLHLWDMDTLWFGSPDDEFIHTTFPYKSWKEFQECKPYKLWKPYILSSWSWKLVPLEQFRQSKRRDLNNHVMTFSAALTSTRSMSVESTPVKEVEMLQIVFLSPDRFLGVHRVEVIVTRECEEDIRDWLKRHMPTFWKLE